MHILEKIERLKTEYNDPIDAPQISAWEAEAKKLLMVQGVAGTDAVQYLVRELRREVETINGALLSYDSKRISDTDRDRLIDRRDLWQRVISFFDVDKNLSNLETEINKQ